MDIFTILLFILFPICLYLYWYLKNAYSYFEQHGIPFMKPTWIFGNMKDAFLLKKHLFFVYLDLYREAENHDFIGVYSGTKPVIMIRDPELAKKILIKDFTYFTDRIFTINPKIEPLAYHVANMKGIEWRNCRIKLTPAFTSGKMKMMFPLLKECGEKLEQILEKRIHQGSFDGKDLIARLMTDIIASCAFGVETNCLSDANSEIRDISSKIFQSNYFMLFRIVWPSMPSTLVKLFDAKFPSQSIENFLTNLFEQTVKYREENKINRNDFVDLLISMKNQNIFETFHERQKDLNKFMALTGVNKNTKLSNEEMTIQQMTAQSFIFFAAGFEPSSSTLSFLMFELAQNADIQNKVREEINTVLENNDSQLTYETMKLMTYTDMVINEILRRHPLVGKLDRECTQNYKIPDTDIVIPQGTIIAIPTIGLHWDKKYYEKPDQFYPEHFTEEAKSKRPQCAYMPFGEGPRMCIAERFGKMQVKIGLIYMLRNFSYRLSSKMKLPLEYDNSFGVFQIKQGIWLDYQKI